MLTPYHAKYFACELTKRCASKSLEKLSSTLSNAQDEVENRKEELLNKAEKELKQKSNLETLFTIRWSVK